MSDDAKEERIAHLENYLNATGISNTRAFEAKIKEVVRLDSGVVVYVCIAAKIKSDYHVDEEPFLSPD